MKKIMVVDDEPDVIFTVRVPLEKTGEYKVIGADSGKQCFELLKSGQIPDIILLDIMMPEMNGWDVFAELNSNPEWKDIPVVFLTAKTDAYSKGFGEMVSYDYIDKPFELSDLKERIKRILS